MFLGHFAVGLAAKRIAPRASLGVLFLAAQFADSLWPVLVAVGVEQVRIDPGNTAFTPLDFVSYPYSHSLLLLIVWGVAFGLLYRRSSSHRSSSDWLIVLIVAALVVSHWFLDFATHRPDMPLYPGGPKLGLGLWNSVPATVTIEVAMYAAGVLLYVTATRAIDSVGRWAFASLAATLLIIYAANATAPPPPSVSAIAIVGMAGAVLFVAWAWWADSHRRMRL
jgi:hypothetical protein